MPVKVINPPIIIFIVIISPKIKKVTKSVKILSSINEEPIMVRQGKHIGTTFHPEMHNNPLIHKYFINIINEE